MAASAQAALLTNIQGAVTVNNGAAAGPTVIIPGDRVRAGEGSADIVYDNGCTMRVAPGQTMVVLYAAPNCNGGLKDGAAAETGIPTETLVIGGLAAGGVATGIILAQQPSSP